MKIYPTEASIRSLQKSFNLPSGIEVHPHPLDNIDIDRINRVLDTIDLNQARKRRAIYNRLYQEALVVSNPVTREISFTNVLLLLAHYKIIDDEKALKYVLHSCLDDFRFSNFVFPSESTRLSAEMLSKLLSTLA